MKEENGGKRKKEGVEKRITKFKKRERKEKIEKPRWIDVCGKDLYIFRNSYSQYRTVGKAVEYIPPKNPKNSSRKKENKSEKQEKRR